ncbi:MAG: Na+/H+ antiporter NhaC family protein [Ruminococcaceae bacterium]|nr:Na+/H+ antiporter NhaC family protein [Oscillospiraceae bacterium]
MKTRKKLLCMLIALVLSCFIISMSAGATEADDTAVLLSDDGAAAEDAGLNVYEDSCPDCDGEGSCYECEDCGFTGVCETCAGTGLVDVREGASSDYFAAFWALIPPIIAIGLALITKEVYSSLFVGIVVGGLLSANVFKPGFSLTGAMDYIINDGLIAAVSDSAGIFIFLVLLGIMVALINKSGGSRAFGNWAVKNIKSRAGAMVATFILGVLIFIDDYFNCLTVGSVMRPVTDSHKISRAKFAYLIDATAAPVCMIAPISSWAAAVASYAEEGQGLKLFIQAIPFNFYSLLTFVFILAIVFLKIDFGPMKLHEMNAMLNGDLYTAGERVDSKEEDMGNPKGKVIDIIVPVAILIVTCVFALVYNGGILDGESFIDAFSNTDATVGLPWGGLIALVLTMVYFLIRRVITFKGMMECIPEGFKAMVPAITILTFATALKNMTGLLGAKYFVADLMNGAAAGLANFLPAIIFVVACGLAFATGTSWGTFGILIPIVTAIFPADSNILIIGISACLAGAVCGDHCSPISDTTIMSSAGAQCNHINHVNTQLPYALTVAGVSFVTYVVSGIVQSFISSYALCAVISLGFGLVAMLGTIFVIKAVTKDKNVKNDAKPAK